VDTPANAEHVFGEGVEAGDVLHEQLRSQRSWQLHNPLAVFVPKKLAENKSSLTGLSGGAAGGILRRSPKALDGSASLVIWERASRKRDSAD
jgi:hypothetical protein